MQRFIITIGFFMLLAAFIFLLDLVMGFTVMQSVINMIATFRVMDVSELILLIFFVTILVLDLTSSLWKKWLSSHPSQHKNQNRTNNQQTAQPQQNLISNDPPANQHRISDNP